MPLARAGCRTEACCSFNGIPNSARTCECEPQWAGDYCERLVLDAGPDTAGLQILTTDKATSTWGGAVLFDEDAQRYHMWASEMVNGCGIDSWLANSRIFGTAGREGTLSRSRRRPKTIVWKYSANRGAPKFYKSVILCCFFTVEKRNRASGAIGFWVGSVCWCWFWF
jgi:hypothetical protein